MPGLALQLIREALADQIRTNVARQPTVYAYDPEGRSGHNITVLPADEYILQETIGDSWSAGVQFDLRIEVPGRLKDSQIAMDDYLSSGQGHTSSVVDAVDLDGTLDGAVEAAIFLGADGPDLTVDPLTALVHFRFMVSRG